MTSGREAARAKAVELTKLGFSASVVARRVKIPVRTVKRWQNQIREYEGLFATGPRVNLKGNPRANRRGKAPLSKRDKLRLRDFVRRNPKVSFRNVAAQLKDKGIYASYSTVIRESAKAGIVTLHRPKKPEINYEQQQKRVVCAKNLLDFPWSTVVVSADEVEVSTVGSLNTHNQVFHGYPGQQVPPLRTVKFAPKRSYYCAVTPNGGLDPVEFTGLWHVYFVCSCMVDCRQAEPNDLSAIARACYPTAE